MTTPSQPLAIFGAGAFGREVLAYAQDLGLNVAGFVDDNAAALDGFDVTVPLLGPFAALPEPARYDWIVAIGDPTVRRTVHDTIVGAGGRLVTLLHPTAYVAKQATVGPGCVICPFAFVAIFVTLGENVVLNTYASAGHDSRIGSHSVLSPYAVVNGFVTLGTATFLGTHATVIPGRHVGAAARVGAGSVVTRDVDAGYLVLGTPAKGRPTYPIPED